MLLIIKNTIKSLDMDNTYSILFPATLLAKSAKISPEFIPFAKKKP